MKIPVDENDISLVMHCTPCTMCQLFQDRCQAPQLTQNSDRQIDRYVILKTQAICKDYINYIYESPEMIKYQQLLFSGREASQGLYPKKEASLPYNFLWLTNCGRNKCPESHI